MGAAPNPYESQTWGNRRRDPFGSDAFDPPLWEYENGAVRDHRHRRPQRSVLADAHLHVGHELAELQPGRLRRRSDVVPLPPLVPVRAAAERRPLLPLEQHLATTLSTAPWPRTCRSSSTRRRCSRAWTLVPYFTFTGDTEYEYLGTLDADQAISSGEAERRRPCRDRGRQPRRQRAVHGDAHTDLDGLSRRRQGEVRARRRLLHDDPGSRGRRREALRVGPAADRRRVATNNGGVPWGFLASVNDVFKTAQADEDMGPLHALHPDILGGGLSVHVDPRAQPLPRSRPSARHDRRAVVDDRRDGTQDDRVLGRLPLDVRLDGGTDDVRLRPDAYSILDQETIARGHLAYYLKWTREALAEGGDAYAAQGDRRRPSQLPSTATTNRRRDRHHGEGADGCSPASTS